MDRGPIIEVQNLRKSFEVGVQTVEVLRGITVNITFGDFVIIFGPSGCGKSTLLHILLGLEPPSDGSVVFLGEDLYENSTEDYRSTFRKKHLGMVYQQSNWVKSLTVRENVAFPLLLLGIDKPKAMAKAYEVLQQLGMGDWKDYIPTELSSGQQQRVALARALINNPQIIIADEPTGNLDYESGQMIMGLLSNLCKDTEKTIVMVTHDLEYITYATSVIRMLDGQVVGVYSEVEKEKLMGELHFKRLGDGTGAEGKNEKKGTDGGSAKEEQPVGSGDGAPVGEGQGGSEDQEKMEEGQEEVPKGQKGEGPVQETIEAEKTTELSEKLTQVLDSEEVAEAKERKDTSEVEKEEREAAGGSVETEEVLDKEVEEESVKKKKTKRKKKVAKKESVPEELVREPSKPDVSPPEVAPPKPSESPVEPEGQNVKEKKGPSGIAKMVGNVSKKISLKKVKASKEGEQHPSQEVVHGIAPDGEEVKE